MRLQYYFGQALNEELRKLNDRQLFEAGLVTSLENEPISNLSKDFEKIELVNTKELDELREKVSAMNVQQE